MHGMTVGFQGELLGERRELEKMRTRLFEKARLAGAMGGHLTPDAYGRNSSRTNMKLPTIGVLRLASVALLAVVFAIFSGDVATKIKNSDTVNRITSILEWTDN